VDGALGRVQEGALLAGLSDASSGLGLVNFLLRLIWVLRGRVFRGRLHSLQLVRGRVRVTDRSALRQMALGTGALRRGVVLVLLALKLLQLLLGVPYVLALLKLLLKLLLLLGSEVELCLLVGLAGRKLLQRGPGRRVVLGRVRLVVLGGQRRGRTRVLALLLNDELVVLRVFVFFGRREQERAVVLPRKGLTLNVVLKLFRVGRAFAAAPDGELSVQAGASGAGLVCALCGTESKAIEKAAGTVFPFLARADLTLLGSWGVGRQTVVDSVVGCGLRIGRADVAEMGALLLNWRLRGSTFAGRAANGGLMILHLRGLLGLGRGRRVGGSVDRLLLSGSRI
jgi:hypothetical protein